MRSITGVSTADAHWKPHPEANSLIQIMSHLAWVEWWWFEHIVGGVEADSLGDDQGHGFDVDLGQTPEAGSPGVLLS